MLSRYRPTRRPAFAAVAFIACWGSAAVAQELVYEPINPSFGGNPFNSNHLIALANAQNDYDPPARETDSSSDIDRFVRSLQSRLLSSLSSEVANAIFGEDAQESGRIIFGDQTIDFSRTLEGVQLTITEGDGAQTVITVPTLIAGAPVSASGASLTAAPLTTLPLTATPLTATPLSGAPLTSGSLTGVSLSAPASASASGGALLTSQPMAGTPSTEARAPGGVSN